MSDYATVRVEHLENESRYPAGSCLLHTKWGSYNALNYPGKYGGIKGCPHNPCPGPGTYAIVPLDDLAELRRILARVRCGDLGHEVGVFACPCDKCKESVAFLGRFLHTPPEATHCTCSTDDAWPCPTHNPPEAKP